MAYFKSLDTSSYNVTTNIGRYIMFLGSEFKEITDPDEIRWFEGNTNFVQCDADGNVEGDNLFVAYIPKDPEVKAPAKPKSEKKVAKPKDEPKKDPKKEGTIKKFIKKVTKKKATKKKKTKKKKKDNKDTDK